MDDFVVMLRKLNLGKTVLELARLQETKEPEGLQSNDFKLTQSWHDGLDNNRKVSSEGYED